VQYCAARVGIVQNPVIASDSLSVLTKMLVAKADKGLTPELDMELDALSSMTEQDSVNTGIGSSIFKVHALPDAKLLTGVTE
jgi:hypothetical protein